MNLSRLASRPAPAPARLALALRSSEQRQAQLASASRQRAIELDGLWDRLFRASELADLAIAKAQFGRANR